MTFFVRDAVSCREANEFGSGSTVSNMGLGKFTTSFEPRGAAPGSVAFFVKGEMIVPNNRPYTLTQSGDGPNTFEALEMSPGSYEISATAYSGQMERANDVVERRSFRSDNDADLADTLARTRELNGGVAAEVESEAHAEAPARAREVIGAGDQDE